MTDSTTTDARGQRLLLALIVVAALASGLGYASAFLPGDTPLWGPLLLALGTATMLVATMALGAWRRGRAGFGGLALPFLFTFLVLAGGFTLALLLTDATPADPVLWLGLPRRAALLLYGVGLLPLFVLPFAYALTFERNTLSPEDWQRVRDTARQLHAQRAVATENAPGDVGP